MKADFEQKLVAKLSQKADPKIPIEQVLHKAMKYYDLNDNGYLEIAEFHKALEKVGMPLNDKRVRKQKTLG
jgi:Ca2+-binding EF-hand superfamily protein